MSTAHLSVGLLTSLSLGVDGVEGQEVAGRGYVRQPVGEMARTDGGLLVNVARIVFPEALEDWGRVAATALYLDGTLFRARTVSRPIDMYAGDDIVFAPGTVQLRDAVKPAPRPPGDRRRVLG